MIHHGLTFQQSKALGFLESVALERNLHSTRSVPTVGVGPGVTFTGTKERIDHRNPSPGHLHTALVDETESGIVLGVPGSTGNIQIQGVGWQRVYVRVRGVAAQIPEQNWDFTQGRAQDLRIGAVMCLTGCHATIAPTATATDMPDSIPGTAVPKNQPISSGVILNLVKSATGFSDGAVQFDRVIAASCLGPVTLQLQVTWPGWVVKTAGFESGFYTGGTSEALVDYAGLTSAQISALFGTSLTGGANAARNSVCRNEGINSTSLLPPYGPMFSDPNNIVQLQVQLLGYRPDTSPRPEAYSD